MEQIIMKILLDRLDEAEQDMKTCGRGKNHGRVEALRAVLADVTRARTEQEV